MEVWLESFVWTPAGVSGRNFGWKFCKGIPIGPLEGVLVDKWEGEVIGEADRGELGESVKWV